MRRSKPRSLAPTACACALLILAFFATGGCGGDGEQETAADGSAEKADPVELHPELLEAQKALGERDLRKARRHLEAVPADDPSYLLALDALTTVCVTLGELESALQIYEELVELKGEDPQLFLGMGWVQYRLERFGEAELATLRAIELAPEDPGARYNVALFRLAAGRLPEAITAYQRAMKRDFEMAYVRTARAHLLGMQEARPDFPDVHYVLAYFANSLGNHREEIDELERYLAMDPQGPAVEVAIGRLEEAREFVGP
jgi:tetratricopeptide (TPR) repeat protein